MKLGRQIKELRMNRHCSQQQLADRVFVSRQTISNWETDKNYPDIQSLFFLSEIFGISVDELIKEDLVTMENQVTNQEVNRKMTVYTGIMLGAFLLAALSLGLVWVLRDMNFVVLIPVILFVIGGVCSLKVEQLKKSVDLKTFSEILAFAEGRSIVGLRKRRQQPAIFFEMIGITIIFVVVFLVISMVSIGIGHLF